MEGIKSIIAMDTISISIPDLSAFLDLLKLYAAETKNPILTDCAWNMSDMFLNSKSEEYIREDLVKWSEGQISFHNSISTGDDMEDVYLDGE